MGLSEELADAEAGIPEVFEQQCGLYPGVASFSSDYDVADYHDWVVQSNGEPVPAPVMLVLQDTVRADSHLVAGDKVHQLQRHTAVTHEIQLQGALFDTDRMLQGVVCPPAISAGWSNDALYDLSSTIQGAFSIVPAAFERWCACFGRTVPSPARLQLLRVLGFSRMRLEMDLSPLHQTMDEQSAEFERVEQVLMEARALKYHSLSLDLMLPAVLADVLVDMIETFLTQTRVECVRLIVKNGQENTCSDSDSLLEAVRSKVLPGLDYRHLGLDWYVTRADSSLGSAARLHWCPLGFTDIEGLDLIGVGPGAVSVLEDASSQNAVQPERYQRRVERGEIPMERGIELEPDDSLRRTLISSLLVAERCDVEVLEKRWGIIFAQYFKTEVSLLRALEQQGKLAFNGREIRTLKRDRESLRTLCRIFYNPHRIAGATPLQTQR